MAPVQSSTGNHVETSQMVDDVKTNGGALTRVFIAKDKYGIKLVNKHINYWCSVKTFDSSQEVNDNYENYPPPSTVSERDSVSNDYSMSTLTAWRVVHNEEEGNMVLATNIMYQHAQAKEANTNPSQPEKKVHPTFDDKGTHDYALANHVHLDRIRSKKIGRYLQSIGKISKDDSKRIQSGDLKLRKGTDGSSWDLIPRPAVVAVAALTVIDTVEAYNDNYSGAGVIWKSAVLAVAVMVSLLRTRPKVQAIILILAIISSCSYDPIWASQADHDASKMLDEPLDDPGIVKTSTNSSGVIQLDSNAQSHGITETTPNISSIVLSTTTGTETTSESVPTMVTSEANNELDKTTDAISNNETATSGKSDIATYNNDSAKLDILDKEIMQSIANVDIAAGKYNRHRAQHVALDIAYNLRELLEMSVAPSFAETVKGQLVAMNINPNMEHMHIEDKNFILSLRNYSKEQIILFMKYHTWLTPRKDILTK